MLKALMPAVLHLALCLPALFLVPATACPPSMAPAACPLWHLLPIAHLPLPALCCVRCLLLACPLWPMVSNACLLTGRLADRHTQLCFHLFCPCPMCGLHLPLLAPALPGCSLCLPCLLLCHFLQPCCPVCLQVYKAKMGELDVAVKMIQKQHVNPQLTPHQALQVMQQVTTCCFAAVLGQLCHRQTLVWVQEQQVRNMTQLTKLCSVL